MRILLTAAALALLASSGAAIAGDKLTGEQKLAKLIDGRVAGKPVSCIPQHLLRDSQVIARTAIVYNSGRRIYVNRTRDPHSLDGDQILVTKTSTGQLCNIDKIDLIDRGSRSWDGFVVLGDFVPYDRVKTSQK
jgi:hypothetical protein